MCSFLFLSPGLCSYRYQPFSPVLSSQPARRSEASAYKGVRRLWERDRKGKTSERHTHRHTQSHTHISFSSPVGNVIWFDLKQTDWWKQETKVFIGVQIQTAALFWFSPHICHLIKLISCSVMCTWLFQLCWHMWQCETFTGKSSFCRNTCISICSFCFCSSFILWNERHPHTPTPTHAHTHIFFINKKIELNPEHVCQDGQCVCVDIPDRIQIDLCVRSNTKTNERDKSVCNQLRVV